MSIYSTAVITSNCETTGQGSVFTGDNIKSLLLKTSDPFFSNLPPFTHISMFICFFYHFLAAPLCLSLLSVLPLCVRSADRRPTGKQHPACLSFATKLLYITAWSPAMQRGFMGHVHAEWYPLSPEDFLGRAAHLQPTSQLHSLKSMFGFETCGRD